MDRIKKFIDCYVPVENCNFKCHYCYISHLEHFNNKTIKIEKSPQFIREALSKERLGGVCMLNFCAGGETLISNDVIPIVAELLKEGHYVMIVTNGSLTSKFEEISKLDERLLKRLFIKFSFHYLELCRLNLLDTFKRNVDLMKKSGVSYTIEVMPNDEIIKYIDEIKRFCLDNFGAFPHVTVARKENGNIPMLTSLSKEKYIKTWSVFNSSLFDFKIKIFGEKRKEFCYAGDWSFILNLATGDVKQCYRGITYQNIYSNIKEPIKKLAVGNNCVEPHCFNGHAFLAFGDIPNIDSTDFAQLRNRETSGEMWIKPTMCQFMKTKLYESNEEYSKKMKIKVNIVNRIYFLKNDFKKKIKKILHKKEGTV